jgi:IMP cyclohydrolase
MVKPIMYEPLFRVHDGFIEVPYNCLRVVSSRCAVVDNGTHVDPISEKLEAGMRMRDAVISVLFGIDYEHDTLNTPRIVGVVDKQSCQCTLGIIRHDELFVQEMNIGNGEAFYIATYKHNFPSKEFRDADFNVVTDSRRALRLHSWKRCLFKIGASNIGSMCHRDRERFLDEI